MYVQKFTDGSAADRDLLGGKGANLAEMINLGMPIPDGITITTGAWSKWNSLTGNEREDFLQDVATAAINLLNTMFPEGIPLLSVRSGARVSMPGMMDTILNVGIIDNWNATKNKLGEKAALDCYRRYQHMFAATALGVPGEEFSNILKKVKEYKYGLPEAPETDADMGVKHLKKLTDLYAQYIAKNHGYWKYNLKTALVLSIEAVFESWNSDRAKAYRRKYGYSDDWGTAVNIQQMVFGNMNDKSCSGVLFTRNPSTGDRLLMGEFLPNAQGEDVVSGVRTPLSLSELPDWNGVISEELAEIARNTEKHYSDMQDMEFTVEDGTLYILQTRTGKRSAEAAFKIAHDLIEEGAISTDTALSRVTMPQYLTLAADRIDPAFDVPPVVKGIPASAGLVTGMAVFTKEAAVASTSPCILIRNETTPDDFAGMEASIGILTVTGGATSHAAVVARGMDKACVVGATDLEIQGCMAGVDGVFKINEGDMITLDGASGQVWVGVKVPVLKGQPPEEAEKLLNAAKGRISMKENVTLVDATHKLPPAGAIYVPAGDMTRYMVDSVLREATAQHTVYVDLNSCKDTSEKNMLALLMGADENPPSPVFMEYITPKAEGWCIKLPDTGTPIPQSVPALKALGWTLVEPAKSWAVLLNTAKVGPVSPAFRARLETEKVPVDVLLKNLEAGGKSFKDIPKDNTPMERHLFDVLGGA